MSVICQQPSEPLTTREHELLNKLEKDIKQHLIGFKKIGNALTVIRDQQLYREEFDTFEDYCREVWDLCRSRAYQLIDCYIVVEYLSTMVDKSNSTIFKILPMNERQARPLTLLSSSEQPTAWGLVLKTSTTENIRISASLIEKCVNNIRHDKVTDTINKLRQISPNKTPSIPEGIQRPFATLLGEVQREADANWQQVGRKAFAGLLRELLQAVEG